MNKPSVTRMEAVLEAIRNSKPIPPTIRDIQEKTGITSSSMVDYYLDRLEAEGKIRLIRNKNGFRVPRGIVPVDAQAG